MDKHTGEKWEMRNQMSLANATKWTSITTKTDFKETKHEINNNNALGSLISFFSFFCWCCGGFCYLFRDEAVFLFSAFTRLTILHVKPSEREILVRRLFICSIWCRSALVARFSSHNQCIERWSNMCCKTLRILTHSKYSRHYSKGRALQCM